MTLEEIQQWENDFAKRKGVPQDYEKALSFSVLKLSEETGEVCRGILKSDWENVQEECFDVICFVCKLSNLMEEFHGTKKLSDVCREKIAIVEKREKMDPKALRMKKAVEETVATKTNKTRVNK